ncbi:hypothetical protein D3C75_995760 [compost metagenome]
MFMTISPCSPEKYGTRFTNEITERFCSSPGNRVRLRISLHIFGRGISITWRIKASSPNSPSWEEKDCINILPSDWRYK